MQSRIPQLDGIRGVAILLVILHNQAGLYPSLPLQRLFANGWMGVDLFFVLSGFLITGILLDTRESAGYLKKFYARRCLRIWPLYFSLLAFMFVAVPILRPSETHVIYDRSSPWWAYPLFLQNFLVAQPTTATGPLGVTWSLAIEEQFYLVWPVIILLVSVAHVRAIAFIIVALSPVLRLYLSMHHVDIYPNVFCRLDGLMAGALLAMLIRSDRFNAPAFLKRAWVLFLLAAPLALLTETFAARWLAFSFTALASAAFVYLALFSPRAWLRTILTNRFLVYTGTISYALYLLHKLPFDAARAFHVEGRPLLALPLLVAAGYAMAALSWILLERPFLRLKRFFESTPGPTSRAITIAGR